MREENVLICARDIGVLSSQPYKSIPRVVPKKHPGLLIGTLGIPNIHFLGAPRLYHPLKSKSLDPTAPKTQARFRGLVWR